MFDNAIESVKHSAEQLHHGLFGESVQAHDLTTGAEFGVGLVASGIALKLHLSETAVSKALSFVPLLRLEGAIGTSKLADQAIFKGVAESATVSQPEETVQQWLGKMAPNKAASVLSPHPLVAEDLAKRLHGALRQDGDIVQNLESALNAHSAEHFPYVPPFSLEVLPEDHDLVATAGQNSISFRGEVKRAKNGDVTFTSEDYLKDGESDLASVASHEYSHLEQKAFLNHIHGNNDITEGEYQRGVRIADSLRKNAETYIRAVKVQNEAEPLAFLHMDARINMGKAGTRANPDFTNYYQTIVDTPREDLPPTFRGYVEKQIAQRSLITPYPTDSDVGRNFHRVLKGQIAAAISRGDMAYKVYENLYHEAEAFNIEKAIKSAYKKLQESNF